MKGLIPLALAIFIHSSAAMSSTCQDPIYTSTNSTGKEVMRLALVEPNELKHYDGELESAKFILVNQKTWDIAKKVELELPSHKSCFSGVKELHIIADEVVFQSGAKVDLADRDLIITARKVTIEGGIEWKRRNKITVLAKEFKNYGGLDAVYVRSKDWGEALKGSVRSGSKMSPVVLDKAQIIARSLYKKEVFDKLVSAEGLYNAILSLADQNLVRKIEHKMFFPSEDKLDSTLHILIASSPIVGPAIVESFESLNKMHTSRNFWGQRSRFVYRPQVKTQIAACGEASFRSHLLSSGVPTSSPFVPKKTVIDFLEPCGQLESAKEVLAFDFPQLDISKLIELYNTSLADFKDLDDKKSRWREVGLGTSKEQARQNLLIDRAQFQKKMAEQDIKINRHNIKQVENQLTRLYKRIDFLNDQLKDSVEYKKVLETLPTDLANSNWMRDIGGFGSAVMGGASGGAGMSGGNPYAAVVGAFLGGLGWMGNKKYEQEQKALQEAKERINKQLRLIQAGMQIRTYAFELADSFDRLLELRSQLQIYHINVRKNQIYIAQAESEILQVEQMNFDLWTNVEPQKELIDVLLEQRGRQLQKIYSMIIAKFQKIFGLPLMLDKDSSQQSVGLDFRNCSKVNEESYTNRLKFESCQTDILNAKSLLEKVGNHLNPYYLPSLPNLSYLRRANVIVFSPEQNKELFQELITTGKVGFEIKSSSSFNPGNPFQMYHNMQSLMMEGLEVFYKRNSDEGMCPLSDADFQIFPPFLVEFGNTESILNIEKKLMFFDSTSLGSLVTHGYSESQISSLSHSTDTYSSKDYQVLRDSFETFDEVFQPQIVHRSPVNKWQLSIREIPDQDFDIRNCFSEVRIITLLRFVEGQ